VEAAAAGKVVGRLDDAPARRLDAALDVRKIVGVDDDQRPAGAARLARADEAARQPAVAELAVVRSIVLERPAEDVAIELLGARHVADVEFDVIDTPVVLRVVRRHASLRSGLGRSCLWPAKPS
jgi:hypothetical protein